MNTHVHRLEDDEQNRIIPDGHTVRVPLMLMDSVQRALANQPALDERVAHNLADGRATLARMQRSADRAAAFADHFAAQRDSQADDSAYGKHCQQISEAWQQVAV